MGKFLRVFFLFSLLFFSNGIKAQTILTDTTHSELFEKISKNLLATPAKNQQRKSKKIIDKLIISWSSGVFDIKEKEIISKFVDTLIAHKISPHPYLYQYINTLLEFSGSNLSQKDFVVWHRYANEIIITEKPKEFRSFLKFTNYFLKSGILNKINTTYLWYFSNGTYSFAYDNAFKIKFKDVDIACVSKKDSSVIRKTSGTFYYDDKQWKGKYGKLKWERFGKKDAEKIYCEFDSYGLDLNKNYFVIDSARLFFKNYFKKPQLGQLEDRVLAGPPNYESNYPAFTIYEEGFELDETYPDFNLRCNLSMKGVRLFATGYKGEKAKAIIKNNDTVFAVFASKGFYLYNDRIESPHTEFSFYFKNDSIYHPDLNFIYQSDKKVVKLFTAYTKTDRVVPFSDSYHKMDLYIPVFIWNIDNDTVYLQNLKNFRNDYKAVFESFNYYSPAEYHDLQVMDQRNPLYSIRDFVKAYEAYDDVIEVSSLAEFLRAPEEQVVTLLIELSKRGFVIYYPKERVAKVKPKLYHYIKSKRGLADYDAIRLVSKVKGGANALIDLKTLDLNIYGIPEVTLSDSQAVYLYPTGKSVSVKKNRDFSFDGTIQVGLLDFYVNNSLFVYDSFMLRLSYIDSMAFYTVKKDSLKANKYNLNRINNVITQMTGSLYIDEPGNKSGVFNFPNYPIFINKENGYVYFDDKKIQGGALTRDKVYYRVESFIFDSVSQFLTNGLAFQGALVTDSMFPEINEPLTIMPDNSLGFTHKTPDTGYSVYAGKGRFFDEITIDDKGLRGNGRIDFLNSTFNSDNLYFFPDSATGNAFDFVVNGTDGGYDFPRIQGDSLRVKWFTADTNLMEIAVIDKNKPLKMFNNALLEGTVEMTAGTMKGYGTFKFDKADVESKNMTFTSNTVAADSADFTLFDNEHTNKIFVSTGYFVNLDFNKKIGEFNNLTKNKGESYVEFPYNRYASTLSGLTWLMDEKKVILETPDSLLTATDSTNDFSFNIKPGLGEFIALNPQQDSLRFFAKKGEYDYNNYTLLAEGVKYIKSGDAGIFPYNQFVKIKGEGNIDTLFRATIIADTLYKYHKIYDAQVQILSKNEFSANGYINYYDRNNLPQQIYLPEIATNRWGKTVGQGKVEAGEYFFLSPEYFFKGDVELVSTEKYLKFKGGFRLNEECIGQEENWVAFERFIDPDNVNFVIDKNTRVSDSAQAIFGLAYSYRKKKFYPLVLQPKESVADNICINAYGKLDFDTVRNAFRVGTDQRLKGDNNAKGNFVLLDNKHCVLDGDGLLNLNTKFYRIKFVTAGKFRHLLIPDSTYFRTSIILGFHFDEQLLNMMMAKMRTAGGKVVDIDKSPFSVAMRELLDKETINRLKVEMSLYGQFKDVPETLKGTIIFTDVKLRWDSYSRSYISEGPIGVGFIDGFAVNKYVEGQIQIQTGRSGSHIHFYLQPDKKLWYFFTYSNGIMQSISSDMDYNVALSEIKEDKRVLNPKDEINYYEYVISTNRKKVDFLRRIDRINKMR